MSLLIILAAALLVLSAALCFGPQLVIYGPSSLRELARRTDARLVSLLIAAAIALLLFASPSGSSLISQGETGQLVATDTPGPAAA